MNLLATLKPDTIVMIAFILAVMVNYFIAIIDGRPLIKNKYVEFFLWLCASLSIIIAVIL